MNGCQYNVAWEKPGRNPNEKFTPSIGKAFESASGKSITVYLDALPFPGKWDGTLVLFRVDSEDE